MHSYSNHNSLNIRKWSNCIWSIPGPTHPLPMFLGSVIIFINNGLSIIYTEEQQRNTSEKILLDRLLKKNSLVKIASSIDKCHLNTFMDCNYGNLIPSENGNKMEVLPFSCSFLFLSTIQMATNRTPILFKIFQMSLAEVCQKCIWPFSAYNWEWKVPIH